MLNLRARLRTGVKHLALAAVILMVAGVFGGLFVLISGIVPIKASSGHWAITAAILDFAKRRSVATHTIRMKVPPLDDERRVVRGATQYAFACEPCHGSPAVQQPRIATRMTPRPPDIRSAALTYDAAALFYIVKHGIKFTGMPAWPARERHDEVWDMVAFLRRLPSTDAAGYAALTGRAAVVGDELPMEDLLGPPQQARAAIAQNCARCHGADGLGRGTGAFPVLAGQREEYLRASLEAFARGTRHSGVMEPVAANLGADEMRAIASYYAGLPNQQRGAAAHGAGGDVARGRELALNGEPGASIPACAECHGPGPQRNANYPRLAGQPADYIRLQLALFRQQQRGGTSYQRLMHKVAGQLSEAQVLDVAAFYASLTGSEAAPGAEVPKPGGGAVSTLHGTVRAPERP